MPRPLKVVVLLRNKLLAESLAFALSAQAGIVATECTPVDNDSRDDDRLSEAEIAIVELGLSLPSAPVGLKILRLGPSDDDREVLAAIESGATGYLASTASLDTATCSVKALAAGEMFCTPRLGAILFTQLKQRACYHRALESLRLTARELQIVRLMREGLSNKEIAVQLGIEVQTVKNHVHNILEKLNQKTRHAAALYAVERGLA